MIPVRNSSDIRNSKNIRNFRNIRHSIHSKRLFEDVDVDVEIPRWHGELGDLDWLSAPGMPGGGRLESLWIGKGLDDAALQVLGRLRQGSLFHNLIAKFLSALYLRMRGNLIQLLLGVLYKIVLIVLRAVYSVLWRILITPLMIIAFILLLVLGVTLL